MAAEAGVAEEHEEDGEDDERGGGADGDCGGFAERGGVVCDWVVV